MGTARREPIMILSLGYLKGQSMEKIRIVHNRGDTEYFFEEGCFIDEWWNAADDPDVSIVRARVEPGVTTRLHRLSGVTERYVILEGSGVAEVGASAAEEVGPGSVVVIPPGVSQRITNVGDTHLVFLAVCTPRFRRELYQDIDTRHEYA